MVKKEAYKMNTFIKRLRKILEDKNMTQRELARLAGVTEVTVSRYLNGERKPRVEIVNKIADVLNVPTDYLLGRSETLKKPSNMSNAAPAEIVSDNLWYAQRRNFSSEMERCKFR